MKNQKMILLVLAVGIILVILVAALDNLLSKKQLGLDNIDQVESGLSSKDISDLEGFIWQSLQRTQGFDDDKREIVALIDQAHL